MRWDTAIRRVPALFGVLFALWLFVPTPAHADVPCGGVSYDNGSTPPPMPSVSDPCAKDADTGAITLGAGALLAATAVGVASALQGRIPSPEESLPEAAPAGAGPATTGPATAGPAPTGPPTAPVAGPSPSGPAPSARPTANQPQAGQPQAVGGTGQSADGNSLTQTAGDPVDVVSGQMITDALDVELPGLLPLVLRRAYASGYRGGRLHGPGWSCTVDQRVEIDAGGIHFFGDDAQTLHYPYPAWPGEPVLPAEGARWPLTWDADGTIRIEDPRRGWTSHFAASLDPAVWLISALTDRNGNRIAVLRAADVPTEVEHCAGYRVAVDSTEHAAGRRVTGLRLLDGTNSGQGTTLRRFDYDARGRLTAVADATGVPAGYGYDQADRITSWTDRTGYRYAYAYDDTGRVVRGSGPDGNLSAIFDYQPLRRVTVVTDSLGQRTEYHYDRYHHVIRVVSPLGHSVLTEYDRYGRPLAHTDELGHTARYTLDEHGDPIRIDRPDGTSIRVGYNEHHLPVQVTSPGGARWQYAYDARGNLLAETDPLGAVTAYTYDQRGNVNAVTDALGHVQRLQTDTAGLVTALTDPQGNTTRLTRDAFGRPVEITDPLGGRTLLAWTCEGLPTSRTNPDGTVERWRHDAEGNETGYQAPDGALTTTEYGPFGVAVARTSPDGTRYEFAYDTELRPTSVTGPTGLVWHYERDATGALTGEVDFNGRRFGYRLDPAGRIVERTNGGGQRVTYRRDAFGRVAEARHDTGAVTHYAYDPDGALIRAQNPDALVEYARDPLGRVLAETVNGARTTWGYDPRGHTVRRVTPTGALSSWTHDPAGRAAELVTPGGWLTFGYDPAGREVSRHLGTTAAITQAFDAAGGMTAQSLWARDAAGSRPLRQRTYAYREDGYLAAVRDAEAGVKHFDLDRLGRITGVHAENWSEQYAYDALGDLTHARWTSPDDTDEEAQGRREYAGTLIRAAGRVNFEHDAQGRVIRKTRRTLSGQTRQWTFAWDADDRLTRATTPEGTVWCYRYDPLGRRIAKQRLDTHGNLAEQTTFSWDGNRLAEQVRAAHGERPEILTWDYEPGTHRPLTQLRRLAPRSTAQPASMAQEEVDQRFHAIVTDLVGTPTELIDPTTGTVTWRATHTLWGNSTTSQGSGTHIPLRFPGQYYDPETRLHYNLHRYYDPEIARYLTPDPLGLSPAPNPHTYVHNPTAWTDPLGLAPCPSGKPTFIADSNGTVVPTSASRLEAGLQGAVNAGAPGFSSFPTKSAGTGYNLPDGTRIRIMQPQGNGSGGLRASFTNGSDAPVSPFTGKPVQPPKPLPSGVTPKQYVRKRTHIDLEP
ncbi:RHS repeat-associated core domain-containing protein [Kitasatospora kifunensis]|uniref:RHS repeat-associated protein n=1 Tax=Kitasatospora kifunensis TaxID=58351 RepID=A0A7W7R9Q0_KITKI|nr:RHS repeat-associated core domain-containing protein [Kitasatospora kifunensis]MBB4928037.1 RHS repeat-associated protein [Kitasatospora kifunensis]